MKTIAAVINTFNEEANLPFALRSVAPWVDEIVVVDMYSRDRTVEIARESGAKVFLHAGPGFEYPPRAFAVEQTDADWILILDADELVPLALSRELRRFAKSDEADVLLLPRTNYLLGTRMAHTGWGERQDLQTRFFRKGCVIGSSLAHHDLVAREGARIKALDFRGDNALVHFNYFDLTHFIEKLNRYTSIEALQAEEKGKRWNAVTMLLAGAKEFVGRYVKNRGFLDGWRGLNLSLCMAFYRIAAAGKYIELRECGPRASVMAAYRDEADKVLREYAASSVNEVATVAAAKTRAGRGK